MSRTEVNLNTLLILIISGILLAAYGVQFIYKEEPCPLCMLQRLGMIGVTCGAALNLCFGTRTTHFGFMLLSALVGGCVALRQISLHVCPGFPHFGIPVLGMSLYTWSFLIFACVVLYVAILLFLHEDKDQEPVLPLSRLSFLAIGAVFFLCLANFISTLLSCGLGPCAD